MVESVMLTCVVLTISGFVLPYHMTRPLGSGMPSLAGEIRAILTPVGDELVGH